MKKLSMVLLIILSLVLAPAPAVIAANLDLVTDAANVLTHSERKELNDRAQAISAKYNCEVAIVTIEEMDDDDGAYLWARYIYEEYDFGSGSEKSGLLFFLSLAERDYALIAYGYGNTAFTDHGKDVMLDKFILPLLKENKYHQAFSVYLDQSEEFLALARAGTPFDRNTDPNAARTDFLIKLAVVILLPLLTAFVICSRWKKEMKTAVTARTAANYIPAGGFNLTGSADMFLYQTRESKKVAPPSSGRGGTTIDSKGYSGRSGKF
jgi:uncharacterized protein